MLKISFFLSLFVSLSWASLSFANTQILFGKDGLKATVPLIAMGGDTDAPRLYDLIQMQPQLEQGKWTKKVAFTDPSGLKIMSIVCVFSTQIQNNGSCVMVINKAPGVSIEPSQHHVAYQLSGPDAVTMSQIFIVPTACGELYRSNDRHLVFSCEKETTTNEVKSFLIEYRQFARGKIRRD